MKILIIGSGGREHALAWKCAQSEKVEQIFIAPGNGGTALMQKTQNIAITTIKDLIEFAKDNTIDLTIVGPEAPLAEGIVDQFEKENLKILGPSQKAAQLESSKAFAKDFMEKHQIPTAKYQSFTEINKAKAYLQNHSLPVVIKADGLAAGKGVIIAETLEHAEKVVEEMLEQHSFGEASQKIVIEEFLQGQEASFICLVDGKHALSFASSQDHKRAFDKDEGPNTGGMGAYSPAPIVDKALHEKILQQVIYPTISGMQQEGIPYRGFLYAGLMIDKDNNIKVLEFNCRLGDPETQPLLMRLQSDLVMLCLKALEGELDTIEAKWDTRFALAVVMASGGYPGAYQKGLIIQGLPIQPVQNDCEIFHAGTKYENNQIITSGGRVLAVTALGNTLADAQQKAYEIVNTITWEQVHYRKDIGHHALAN